MPGFYLKQGKPEFVMKFNKIYESLEFCIFKTFYNTKHLVSILTLQNCKTISQYRYLTCTVVIFTLKKWNISDVVYPLSSGNPEILVQ